MPKVTVKPTADGRYAVYVGPILMATDPTRDEAEARAAAIRREDR